MLITFIHISDWFWHRCSVEDEVYKLNTVRRKPRFWAVPHRCGFCTCVWSCSFISFLCRKARRDVQTGSTCVWGQLGLFCGLSVVSWIHYLNLTRKLFPPLGVLKFGVEITITSINLTTGPNICKLLYSLLVLFKHLGNKIQMLLKITWRLKSCSLTKIFA